MDIGETPEEYLDLEVSTPDFNIDNENSLTHIAQQERTFSEENMASLQAPARKEVRVTVHDSPSRQPTDSAVAQMNAAEERVVYSESEKDTSCVVDMQE